LEGGGKGQPSRSRKEKTNGSSHARPIETENQEKKETPELGEP